MKVQIRKHLSTTVIALVAGMIGANAPAIAHGVKHAVFSHNSDKLDGIHGAKASAANKKNRFVATDSTSKFPVSVIPKADAETLDGQDSSAFAATSHGHDAFDINSGELDDARIPAAIARDSELPTVGTGLTNNGGAFDVDSAQVQSRVTTACAAGEFLRSINQDGTAICAADAAGTGDITGVTAGTGLTGGGSSGDVSLSANLASAGGNNGSATTIARSDHAHPSDISQMAYVSGGSIAPDGTIRFLAPTVQVIIGTNQRVLVTSHRALGAGASPATGLDIWICYQSTAPGSAIQAVGGGMLGLSSPANLRLPVGLSAVVSGIAAGTYNVGLCGRSSSANWTNNEFGYTTALVAR